MALKGRLVESGRLLGKRMSPNLGLEVSVWVRVFVIVDPSHVYNAFTTPMDYWLQRAERLTLQLVALVTDLRGGPFDFWGGGGSKIQTVQGFFLPRRTRQIFFPVKVQRKTFFPNIFRSRKFFLPLIITAYSNVRLSYSYRQRRNWVFQSEEAGKIPRGACALFYMVMNVLLFPTLKRAGLLTKKGITAPRHKTCRDRV